MEKGLRALFRRKILRRLEKTEPHQPRYRVPSLQPTPGKQ